MKDQETARMNRAVMALQNLPTVIIMKDRSEKEYFPDSRAYCGKERAIVTSALSAKVFAKDVAYKLTQIVPPIMATG